MSPIAQLHDELMAYGLSMPEAWVDNPWGDTVLKVRRKIFLFLGDVSPDGSEFRFTAKLPESAAAALELPTASPTGYGLGRAGWVTVRIGYGSRAPRMQQLHWIWESYGAVAPKGLARGAPLPV